MILSKRLQHPERSVFILDLDEILHQWQACLPVYPSVFVMSPGRMNVANALKFGTNIGNARTQAGVENGINWSRQMTTVQHNLRPLSLQK